MRRTDRRVRVSGTDRLPVPGENSAVLAVLIEELAETVVLLLGDLFVVQVGLDEVLGVPGGLPGCLSDHGCQERRCLGGVHLRAGKDLVHIVLERGQLMGVEHGLPLGRLLGLGAGLLGVVVVAVVTTAVGTASACRTVRTGSACRTGAAVRALGAGCSACRALRPASLRCTGTLRRTLMGFGIRTAAVLTVTRVVIVSLISQRYFSR